MVVDSCTKSRRSDANAAIDYLDSLGVDIGKSVEIIVATHWHDDHIRGLHSTVERAENSIFFCSSALRSNEFLALVDRNPDPPSRHTSGTSELRKIGMIINRRREVGGRALAQIRSSTRLFFSQDTPVAEIWALSPSDEDVARGIEHIASLLPKEDDPGVSRIPSLEPNDTSVTLLIKLRDGSGILLGADLEHFPSDRRRGWHAVIDNSTRPKTRSYVYKVPHHGAVSSYCPEVWEHLLEEDPLCLLSPFGLGSQEIPTPEDVIRLQKLSSKLLISASGKRKNAWTDRSVEKIIHTTVRSMRPVIREVGHIQLRRDSDGWLIRLSKEAAEASRERS